MYIHANSTLEISSMMISVKINNCDQLLAKSEYPGESKPDCRALWVLVPCELGGLQKIGLIRTYRKYSWYEQRSKLCYAFCLCIVTKCHFNAVVSYSKLGFLKFGGFKSQNNTVQVWLYRTSSEPFLQRLVQKFSCPFYVDLKTIQDTLII